ncbi:hypothetical protein Holit_01115 [Hollandina sp. SP2]
MIGKYAVKIIPRASTFSIPFPSLKRHSPNLPLHKRLDHGRLRRALWVRRSTGIGRTSLRSCSGRSVLTYTVDSAPKRQRGEARGGPLAYCRGPTGASNLLAGGKDRASITGGYLPRSGTGLLSTLTFPLVQGAGAWFFCHCSWDRFMLLAYYKFHMNPYSVLLSCLILSIIIH